MKWVIDKATNNPWVECGVRWLLGIVFLYASIHKIMEPASFAKVIYGYKLLPAEIINLSAIILPYVEAYVGLFLILGIYPRSAALIVVGLLGLFILAISINLIRGHEFDCGCFSVNQGGRTGSNVELLFRDILYFSLGMIPIFYNGKRRFALYS